MRAHRVRTLLMGGWNWTAHSAATPGSQQQSRPPQGASSSEVQQRLVNEGVDRAATTSITQAAAAVVVEARRRSINSRILSGVVLLSLGILITAVTHAGAGNTGGYYI